MLQPSKTVFLLLTLLTGVLIFIATSTRANAFALEVHAAILRGSLPVGGAGPTEVDPVAMNEIIGSLWNGSGNLGSDLHQSDEYRHFDNAPSPAAICALANQAWGSFVTRIYRGSQVQGFPAYDRVLDPLDARSAFGALTHSLQDFYSHSNWLELGNRQAAPIFPTCDPAALPAGLQTGYFKLSIRNPVSGCPTVGSGNPSPPSPFAYCHLTLNKDKPERHGADLVPGGGGTTYHQLAAEMARAHTTVLYNDTHANRRCR
jgi:hypothetical protein